MSALEDLVVIELCTLNTGPYCGKLLADMGAEVIKVEPPSGDPARRSGPFPKDVPHPERSGTFLYLNTNKQSVTLDMETETGRKLFRELVSKADVLLEDLPPGTLPSWGLGYDSLAQQHPELVMTSITPFGQDGPYRDYKAYPVNTYHAGGEGYTMPGSVGWLLYSDRPPLQGAGFAGEHYAGLSAAVATMMAVAARAITGKGQYVDVSKQEALLNLSRPEVEKFPNENFIERRATRMFPVGGSFQCKDGFVHLLVNTDDMWKGLVELMENPEWVLPEYSTRDGRRADGELINTMISEWTMSRTKDEIYHQGQAHGIAVTPYMTPEEVYASPQLQARNYIVEVEHPEAGKIKMPSAS